MIRTHLTPRLSGLWPLGLHPRLGMPSVVDLEMRRLRAMTATEKVATLQALWRQAWSLTAAGVRGRHPEWTPQQADVEVRRVFLRESP